MGAHHPRDSGYDKRGEVSQNSQIKGAARHGDTNIGYSPDDCWQHILFNSHNGWESQLAFLYLLTLLFLPNILETFNVHFFMSPTIISLGSFPGVFRIFRE